MTSHDASFERPPEGLARGRFAAPPWLVAALAFAIMAGAVAWLVRRARAARRAP